MIPFNQKFKSFLTLFGIILLAFFISSQQRNSQVSPPTKKDEKLGPKVSATLIMASSGKSIAEMKEAGYSITPEGHLDVFILGEITRSELESKGVIVRSELSNLFTAYVPILSVDDVTNLDDVKSIIGASQMEAATNKSVPATGVHLLRNPGPDFEGMNGEGVLVAIIDSGIDYDHGDFKNQDGTSRIVSIWDQDDPQGPSPSTSSYGTVWSMADINGGLIPHEDNTSHGTHVAGVAAGNGSCTDNGIPAYTYVGMAPKSDILVVKTDFNSTTTIIDGIVYAFHIADSLNVPAVVNLSLGYRFGPHDGTSVFEQAIDMLADTSKLICVAAQNWRGLPYHAEAFADSMSNNIITFDVSSSALDGRIFIDGYYDISENMNVFLTTPSGVEIGPVILGSENAPYPGIDYGSGQVYIFHDTLNSYSVTHPEVYIEIQNTVANQSDGEWMISFVPITIDTFGGEIDFWLGSSRANAGFVIGNQPDEEMISEPGNAFEVITVGAYSTKEFWQSCTSDSLTFPGFVSPEGTIAYFSNPGPTRDNRIKPDITAGGIVIVSSLSSDVIIDCNVDTIVANDYKHVAAYGTSFATPHVTGFCALLLQENPMLNSSQAKQIITEHALVDTFTGTVPNNDWGAGKLYYESSPLAIDLVSLDIYCNKDSVILNWNSNMGETNIAGFDIEGSNNGVDFEFIKFAPGKNQLSSINKYSENFISDFKYFRLKQIEIDHSYSFSSIVYLDQNECIIGPELILVTNFDERLNYLKCVSECNIKVPIEISIYSINGTRLLQYSESLDNVNEKINSILNENPFGLYILNVTIDQFNKPFKIINF